MTWLGYSLVLVVGLLLGCGGSSTRRLQIASAGATGCDPAAIDVSQMRGGTQGRSWIARCGEVRFQCSSVPDSAVSCTPVGPWRCADSAEPADVSGNSAEDGAREEASLRRQGPRFEFSRRGDVLRGVRATFRTEAATLTFEFSPERSRELVQVTILPSQPDTAATCETFTLGVDGRAALSVPVQGGVAQVLRTTLVEVTLAERVPTAQLCGGEWALRRADVYGFEQLARYMDEALAAAPVAATPAVETPTAVPVSTPPVPTGDPRQVVRGYLDEQRAVLRGCAGVARDHVVSVQATWDDAGVVTVTVRGEADAAVHECATSALGGRRAPAGAAGRLIHALP